jgi:hypothetical protein
VSSGYLLERTADDDKLAIPAAMEAWGFERVEHRRPIDRGIAGATIAAADLVDVCGWRRGREVGCDAPWL